MNAISIGNTLSVSRVCVGTMTFGGQTDEQTAASMIDLCLDNQVNFIDTANKYQEGVTEEILGRLLRDRRDQVVLASKVFGKMGEGPDESGLSRPAILRAVDDSLRRLRTDFLDIYYLHQPDQQVPLEETLAAMDLLVRQGKVRCVGASNYASWQVAQALWLADQNGYQPLSVMQPMYNLLARGIEQEFLPMSEQFGLATVAYNPLAGGLLTGKHDVEQPPQSGTRFDGNQQYLDRYWSSANFDVVNRLRAIAGSCGRTPVSLSIGWLMHHTAIDCVILGASQLGHLEQNLQACSEGPLPLETVAACDELWQQLRGASPQYNR